jgi:hypothetical protein
VPVLQLIFTGWGRTICLFLAEVNKPCACVCLQGWKPSAFVPTVVCFNCIPGVLEAAGLLLLTQHRQ